jgi:hypothetical protein
MNRSQETTSNQTLSGVPSPKTVIETKVVLLGDTGVSDLFNSFYNSHSKMRVR